MSSDTDLKKRLRAYQATTPVEIETTVNSPQIYFERVICSMSIDETGCLTYARVPCIGCDVDLGRVEEGYWSANIYLGPMRSYHVGCVCDMCLVEESSDFDLADMIKQTFINLLRNLAGNIEQTELQINKPTH